MFKMIIIKFIQFNIILIKEILTKNKNYKNYKLKENN